MEHKDELQKDDRRDENIADEGATAGPLGKAIGTFDTDNVGADLGTGGVGAPSEDEDATQARRRS